MILCHLPHIDRMILYRILSGFRCNTWLRHAVYEQLLKGRITSNFWLPLCHHSQLKLMIITGIFSDARICWGRHFQMHDFVEAGIFGCTTLLRQALYQQVLKLQFSLDVGEFNFATFLPSTVWCATKFSLDARLSRGRNFTNSCLQPASHRLSVTSTLSPSSAQVYDTHKSCLKFWMQEFVEAGRLPTAALNLIVYECQLATFLTPSLCHWTKFFQLSDAGLFWGRQFTKSYLQLASPQLYTNNTLQHSSPRAYET